MEEGLFGLRVKKDCSWVGKYEVAAITSQQSGSRGWKGSGAGLENLSAYPPPRDSFPPGRLCLLRMSDPSK